MYCGWYLSLEMEILSCLSPAQKEDKMIHITSDLNSLPKVYEKIATEEIMIHLESNALLSNTQHGFRKKSPQKLYC